MTTNSPNPFLGDVQALIADCLNDIEEIQYEISTYGDESGRRTSKLNRQKVALVALMAEPCGYHSEGAMQVDPVWPTPYGVGFRVEPKPQGVYKIPVYHAQPVKIMQLPECNSDKPGELAERARAIIDDCNSLIRRINATEQPVSSDLAIPDGWKLVPIEPTEDMLIHGFESEPDELFSSASEWEEYEAMSGCQRASHRALLCWAAMLSAAPEFSQSEKP